MPVSGFIAAIVLISLAAIGARFALVWWRYRGARVVRCPETGRPAGIRIAAARAATASISGRPKLDLSSCSRWPARAACGRECLGQVQDAPEDCLVRNILLHWYEGKRCRVCGQPFGEIPLGGAAPAILRADNLSVEWSEVPAENLTETLAASSPICFGCHMAKMLLRQHPELVVNRSRPVDKTRVAIPGSPDR